MSGTGYFESTISITSPTLHLLEEAARSEGVQSSEKHLKRPGARAFSLDVVAASTPLALPAVPDRARAVFISSTSGTPPEY